MDFFDRQDASRRSTRWLVVTFAGAFLIVALATSVLVAFTVGAFNSPGGRGSPTVAFGSGLMPNLTIFGAVLLGTLALMTIASLYRTMTLSRGGGQVASMLGGTRVAEDSSDRLHRRLINVVEEMSIASGVPVPEIYVLDSEAGINAFAAGLNHTDAAVAVTRGSLDQLNRGELRGVIAHEFSHILNGDMRLNLRLMGLSFGILVLSMLGRSILRGTRFRVRSRNRGSGAIWVLAVGLTVIGGIGVVLSRLIKAAVSRQREVLADASAVQFTREPLALAGALKKIGGFTTYLSAVETEEVSHMLFGRGTAGFKGWFATHPPLVERIRALDPSFDGVTFPPPRQGPDIASEEEYEGVSQLAAAAYAAPVRIGEAGSVDTSETGNALLRSIPGVLTEAAHGAESSFLLVLAIAIAHEHETTRSQTALIEAQLGRQRAAACLELHSELENFDRRLWLPLVEICVPALKRRPRAQIDYLFDLLDRLAMTDSRVTLFEYLLPRLLRAYLDPPTSSRPARSSAVDSAWLVTLTAVASRDSTTPEAIRAAVASGIAATSRAADAARLAESITTTPDLGGLDAALDTLARAENRAKRDILRSLEATIAHDGHVGIVEAELYRVVAATIGCPVPPPAVIEITSAEASEGPVQ